MEIHTSTNVLQSTQTDLTGVIDGLRNELATRREELAAADNDGPAWGLAVAGDRVALFILCDCAGDMRVPLLDDIRVCETNIRARIQMNVHLARRSLSVLVANAPAFAIEAVGGPVVFEDVVDPRDSPADFLLVDEAEFEDAVPLCVGDGKDGFCELRERVDEPSVFCAHVAEEVVFRGAEPEEAVHSLVVCETLNSLGGGSKGCFGGYAADGYCGCWC